MSAIENLSRRRFLQGTLAMAGSALVLGVFERPASARAREAATPTPFAPNAFVRIDPDGQVTIVVARSEMGQHVRTSMAMLVAEELDLDLAAIRIVQGDGDARYGDQNTDGSTSVRAQWMPLRQAGAAARMMLVAAAAKKWGVDAALCRAERGAVVHGKSGRRFGYGELVAQAATLPVPREIVLKRPEEFRLIGRSQRGVDNADLVTGKARFGLDVRIPGMRFASIERAPVVGGRVKRFEATQARAVRGVSQVVELAALPLPFHTNGGIAVVADSTWAAQKGRGALVVEWDDGPNGADSSAALAQRLAMATAKEGKVFRNEGDAPGTLARSKRVMEAVYEAPNLVHAPMEPPCCTAWVKEGGCEVWAPLQDPQGVQEHIAKFLGIDVAKVQVHVTLLGGGFGRKSKPDFALEAVHLSKTIGGPVQVVWTREDEIRHGFYRAQSRQLLRAALDEQGRPVAWLHRSAFPTIDTLFDPKASGPAEWEMAQGAMNLPYRIPHLRVEGCAADASFRRGWMRSVCHTFHTWAINCFIDELAQAAGKDPVAYHLELLGEPRVLELRERDRKSPYKFDTGRLTAVIARVAKEAGWGRKPEAGRGLGFAAQYSFLSYVAAVAEVSLDARGVRVHRVDVALDCGTLVNPDSVRAQAEGAVAYALSSTLHGEITLDRGRIEQGNFDDYRVLRLTEMPEVRVHLVESTALPTGIGEPVVPVVAPAVCNALYPLTRKRIYKLPLSTLKA